MHFSHNQSKTQLNLEKDGVALRRGSFSRKGVSFSEDDVVRVIRDIIKKGSRFREFKKEIDEEDGENLERRLLNSSYMVLFD